MLKLKKLVSLILSFSMVMSITGTIFAEEIRTLEWNNKAVVSDAEHLFENFPAQLDKHIDSAANLSISFQYLKTISEGADAVISITDVDTGIEVFNSSFLDSNYLIWENVEIDKAYGVVITETINGNINNYAAMLKTFNTAADFPVNFTLGDFTVSSDFNVESGNIMLREAGLIVECNHDETEECSPECSPSFYTKHISESEFNTFYDTLDANKLYEIQTNAVVEGVLRNFNGFISTHEGGDCLGIFTRSYSFYPMEMSELEERLESGVTTFDSENNIMMSLASDSDFDNAVVYDYFENSYGNLNSSRPDVMFKWEVPETGYYTIEK